MRKLVSILIISIFLSNITFISYAVNEPQNTTDGNNITQNITNESINIKNGESNENEINALQQQKDEIQNQAQEAEEKLQEIDTSLSENLQQIAKIDISINSTQENLNELNKSVKELEEEIKVLQTDLEETTKQYNIQQELLDQRLVAMYKSGETQYLDVLLKSTSFTDFISSYFLIGELMENDKKLLENVAEQKEELELKQKQIQSQQESINSQKQIQLKTQKVLENTKTFRNNLIIKLSKEEQEVQAKIDEYYNQIEKIEQEIQNLALTKSFGEEYTGGAMIWPIPGYTKITSSYGMRTHPITGVYKLHTGVDISAPAGANFVAMAKGIVTKASYNSAYGNMVIIDHGGGVQTLYAHGSAIEVEVGDVVNAGDVVLKVGSTGYSTGPHAHFEIRINGETVNPMEYLEVKQ